MSEVNIFFRAYPSFGTLRLDATLTESISQQAQVTKFPTEVGFNVSDYVFLDPVKLSITGKIAPMNSVEIGATGINVIDAASKIESMMQLREPVQVVAGIKFFPEMVMSSRKIDRLSDNTLDVSLEFEEIIRVESKTTTVNAAKKKPSKKGGAKTKDGKSKEDAGKAKERPKSTLEAMPSQVDFFKKLVGAK